MAEDSSFADLLAQLRTGDEDAAALIFQRYARRLIALAQNRLDTLMRQKEDPEDVIQSVFKSFFARQAERPYDLDSWDSLWSLLAQITVHKCGHRIERFRAARRDVRREVSSTALEASSSGSWEGLAREPTPSEAAMLAETLEHLMRRLGKLDRQVLTLSLQGCSIREVSTQVGYSERTVHRVLKFVKDHLQSIRASGADSAR